MKRRRAVVMVFPVVGVLVLVGLTQCSETQRGLGDQCLRNADCVSGYCAGQQCVAAGNVYDGAAPFEASAVDASDTGTDAVTPAKDAGHEAAPPPKDAGHEASSGGDASDAGMMHDAHDDAHDAKRPAD